MKKIFLLVFLLGAAAGGYYTWLEMQKTETTDDAEIDGNMVAVSPRVTGHVIEAVVEDQQFVNKGDVLVKLDPKDFEVAVARAKADLNDALANLQSSRTDVPLTTATTGSTLSGAKSLREEAAQAITWAEQQQSVAQARQALAEANVKVAEANLTKAADRKSTRLNSSH